MSVTDIQKQYLTPKDLVMFNEQYEKLKYKIDETWAEVDDALVTSGTCPTDFQKIREVERLISLKFKEICISGKDYKKYLLSQNTEEVINLLRELKVSTNTFFQLLKEQAERAKLELIHKEGELSNKN